jgi:hypothetical protein
MLDYTNQIRRLTRAITVFRVVNVALAAVAMILVALQG